MFCFLFFSVVLQIRGSLNVQSTSLLVPAVGAFLWVGPAIKRMTVRTGLMRHTVVSLLRSCPPPIYIWKTHKSYQKKPKKARLFVFLGFLLQMEKHSLHSLNVITTAKYWMLPTLSCRQVLYIHPVWMREPSLHFQPLGVWRLRRLRRWFWWGPEMQYVTFCSLLLFSHLKETLNSMTIPDVLSMYDFYMMSLQNPKPAVLRLSSVQAPICVCHSAGSVMETMTALMELMRVWRLAAVSDTVNRLKKKCREATQFPRALKKMFPSASSVHQQHVWSWKRVHVPEQAVYPQALCVRSWLWLCR